MKKKPEPKIKDVSVTFPVVLNGEFQLQTMSFNELLALELDAFVKRGELIRLPNGKYIEPKSKNHHGQND
jgi:hypothetical protein